MAAQESTTLILRFPWDRRLGSGAKRLGGWRKETSPLPFPRPRKKNHPEGRSFLFLPGLGCRSLPWAPPHPLPPLWSCPVPRALPAGVPPPCSVEGRVRSQQPGNPSQGSRSAVPPGPCAPSRPVPPVGATRGRPWPALPPAAPGAPSVPGPHTFPRWQLRSALSSALLRSPATLRLICLLPPQSSAQPHRSNRWGTVATYRRLCGSSPEAAVRPVPSRGGTMGGTAGARGRGGRADLLLYSLPASGLWVKNSFVQPSRSLCPSSCSAQSLLGLCPGSGSRGLRVQGRWETEGR